MSPDSAKSKEKEKDHSRLWHFSGYVDKKMTALLTTMAAMGFLIVLNLQALYSGRSCPCGIPLHQSITISPPLQNLKATVIHSNTTGTETYDLPKDNKLIKPQSQAGEVTIYANERHFVPHGLGAYLFVHMGTYRGGPNTFATVGLASKPLHVFGKPYFICEWIPSSAKFHRTVTAKGWSILPDWGYGRVYTVVVVNCTFDNDVGTDVGGGELIVHAHHGDSFGEPARIPVLKEAPEQYNASVFDPPYPYDYLYCGSSLFGEIDSQRIREWVAYHAKIFGPRSHFVFHDAGGIHPDVQKVLEPWVKIGRVTIQNIREQEKYDGYYYNQFLIVNDCLHRYRFKADWTFFFDVDEYIYTPPGTSLADALRSVASYTQFTFEQMPMSNKLCLATDSDISSSWGFEKLVFHNVKRGKRLDRKYAIRARNAFATGIHMSENIIGQTTHSKGRKIRYYHYHDTISYKGEVCREFVSPHKQTSTVWFEKIPYKYDGSMVPLAAAVKEFELQQIGPQPLES
ncbi:hypothetical protein O6H91_12G005300 [Diphasiastrum complanatum]|uniref:Uncharacterized protein n=2 Tax=Diphasiastrum complanatum TaxID=34168 RepID=A0ACC2BZ04_DIPCM|nr:hypothetical protein O6H91_12G005100 [Diphasiastrum complanatum]KAJ7534821.1 hypothetical protein O6H91_12G005300 [Diphasiastrum complanatum]